MNAIYLPASFIAGAFFSPAHFPSVLRRIADVLPLTYFLRLIRNVMLHDQAIWTQGTNVAVIAAWGLARSDRRPALFPLGAERGLGFAAQRLYDLR